MAFQSVLFYIVDLPLDVIFTPKSIINLLANNYTTLNMFSDLLNKITYCWEQIISW